MVTYLSPFIPQLSSQTATLRGILKTDVEYSWNATYQVAFDKLKSLVCEDTTLRFLQHEETSDNPSQCIRQGTRSCTHPG